MPDLDDVNADELAAVLPPEPLDLPPDDVAPAIQYRLAYFDAAIAEVDRTTLLYDAWQHYLDREPPRPAPQTLAELVARARAVLRSETLTRERMELTRRKDVLTAVRTEVAR